MRNKVIGRWIINGYIFEVKSIPKSHQQENYTKSRIMQKQPTARLFFREYSTPAKQTVSAVPKSREKPNRMSPI